MTIEVGSPGARIVDNASSHAGKVSIRRMQDRAGPRG